MRDEAFASNMEASAGLSGIEDSQKDTKKKKGDLSIWWWIGFFLIYSWLTGGDDDEGEEGEEGEEEGEEEEE